MKLRHLLILSGLCYIGWAQAEIYKRVDADGHVTYSSVPIKGAKKLHLAPLPTMPPPPHTKEAAADFPRVDSATQKERDNTRKQILQDELAAEEKALAEARADVQESNESPGGGAGKVSRGTTERVQMHEKNIEALKTELANQSKQ